MHKIGLLAVCRCWERGRDTAIRNEGGSDMGGDFPRPLPHPVGAPTMAVIVQL